MQFDENFVTDVMEKVAQGLQDGLAAAHAGQVPAWADLDMLQRQQMKNNLLPVVLGTLDAAKEVRGDIAVVTSSTWPVQDDEVADSIVQANLDDDGRSPWTWVLTANGDLLLGVYPRGATYEAVVTPSQDDYDAANMTAGMLQVHYATVSPL